MKMTYTLGIAALLTFAVCGAPAQMVTIDEAHNVAENWVALRIHQTGHWGEHESATVVDIRELARDTRLLGYFCQVEPIGFVVVSLRHHLPAVKAFSADSDLDPQAEAGMAALIKDGMQRVLDGIEARIGPIDEVSPEALEQILVESHRASWDLLGGDVALFRQLLEAGGPRADYYEGETLLDSSWHQRPPYNDDCPDLGCSWGSYNDYNSNAVVGCVATAGAQIMRYWNWPPWGQGSPYDDRYDWPNMCDSYNWNPLLPGFIDENAIPCTQAQINAVAELCAEIGVAVATNYGCAGSSAFTWAMEAVYEDHFRYGDCLKQDRWLFLEPDDWYDAIRSQLNRNRPIHYRIEGHSVVCDGWMIQDNEKYYHMNYGWDNADTMWYVLDDLLLGGYWIEYMLEDIYPDRAIGHVIGTFYPLVTSFPYRYFDRDATGTLGVFQAGHRLQFLPHVTVKCVGDADDAIGFVGDPETRLFTRGDESRGVRIYHGAFAIRRNGMLVLH